MLKAGWLCVIHAFKQSYNSMVCRFNNFYNSWDFLQWEMTVKDYSSSIVADSCAVLEGFWGSMIPTPLPGTQMPRMSEMVEKSK